MKGPRLRKSDVIEVSADENKRDEAQERAKLDASPKPTKLGQMVLDAICDAVWNQAGFGYTGFSIGNLDQVVAWVAKDLTKPVKTIAGALGHLSNQGLLQTHGFVSDRDLSDMDNQVMVTHSGWYRCSSWDETKLDTALPTADITPFHEWATWDGIDGTDFNHPALNWEV